jgi:hypothetical protein
MSRFDKPVSDYMKSPVQTVSVVDSIELAYDHLSPSRNSGACGCSDGGEAHSSGLRE